MSTLTKPPAQSPPPPEEDRFRYGYRYVPRITAEGEEISDQVPLTPHDVLHPQEGDYLVHNDPHSNDCMYLKSVAKRVLADDPTALVLSDHRIDLDIAGVEPVGSDLAVILGLKERKRPGATFYVADEGVRLALVGEITSPDTRANDLGIKKDYYHQARVPLYVIVDTKDREKKGVLRLIGYRHAPGQYEKMDANDKGWLWLEPLRLWLGTEGDQLRLFDIHGQLIGDYTEVSRALADAELKLQQEEAARKEAAARQMEAEARAEAEARKRQELERRLREIEDKIRQAPGNGSNPA